MVGCIKWKQLCSGIDLAQFVLWSFQVDYRAHTVHRAISSLATHCCLLSAAVLLMGTNSTPFNMLMCICIIILGNDLNGVVPVFFFQVLDKTPR